MKNTEPSFFNLTGICVQEFVCQRKCKYLPDRVYCNTHSPHQCLTLNPAYAYFPFSTTHSPPPSCQTLTYSFPRALICLFIRLLSSLLSSHLMLWCVRSLLLSYDAFAHSLMLLIAHSCTCTDMFTRAVIRSLVPWFVHPFTYALARSLKPSVLGLI